MDASNELHFLQKLRCSLFYVIPIVSLSSQSLQVVVSPQTRCATSENHERRKLSARLDSTSVSKQHFG